MIKTVFLAAWLFIAYAVSAQPHRLENERRLLALKEKTKGFEQDTSYINLLTRFSNSFYEINADSLLFYSQRAYGYAKSIHYEKGEAGCLAAKGHFYCLQGDYTQMLTCYQQALSLAEKIHYRGLEANMITCIGQFYLNTGKEEEALPLFKKAYAMEEEMGSDVGKAYLLVDIAGIYLLRHDNNKALELYRTALTVQKDSNSFTAAFIRVDIGCVLSDKGQYAEALACFAASLQYYRRTGDKMGRMNTLNAIATTLKKQGRADTAIACATESFSLAKEIKNKEGMANAGECLSGLYESTGNYRKSLEYFKLFKTLSDSLFNEDTRKKTAELQV